MRRFVITAALVIFPAFGMAQEFEFSGIKWGSDISQLEQQLTSNGYTTTGGTLLECRLAVKFSRPCTVRFSGNNVQGLAQIVGGQLQEITVFTGGAGDAVEQQLTQRYGPPIRPPGANSSDPFTRAEAIGKGSWRSPTGASIHFDRDNVYYFSPASNRSRGVGGVRF